VSCKNQPEKIRTLSLYAAVQLAVAMRHSLALADDDDTLEPIARGRIGGPAPAGARLPTVGRSPKRSTRTLTSGVANESPSRLAGGTVKVASGRQLSGLALVERNEQSGLAQRAAGLQGLDRRQNQDDSGERRFDAPAQTSPDEKDGEGVTWRQAQPAASSACRRSALARDSICRIGASACHDRV
jgi:hypothetical protein